MKNLLATLLLSFSVSAQTNLPPVTANSANSNFVGQTNWPVVQIKQFRGTAKSRVVLGHSYGARPLRGIVIAVDSDTCLTLEVIANHIQDSMDGKKIVIHNHPATRHLANGDEITFYAEHIGVIHGVNADGSEATGDVLELWEYYDKQAADEKNQIAAENLQKLQREQKRIKNDEQKKLNAAKALKYNQDAADKGDAYGLMRMGERYRDGEGVEKDLAKARDYLQHAAQAGSETAKAELANLH